MKWFKHLSGSLKDSFIFELIEEFGGDGYLVFFGVLEIMSDEFDIFNPGYNIISIKKMQNTFQLSRQKVVKILRRINEKSIESLQKTDRNLAVFCQKTDKMNEIHQKLLKKKSQKMVGFLCHVNTANVEIICMKLKDLCDEYTTRELKRLSGVTPELIGSYSGVTPEQEREEEEEEDKKTTGKPVRTDKKKNQKTLDFIRERVTKIEGMLRRKNKKFNVWAWIHFSINENRSPDLIIASLDGLIKMFSKIEGDVWAYSEGIVKSKMQNFNEREHIRKTEQFKNFWIQDPEIKKMIEGLFK
jgi:hypothetical protein